MKSKTDPNTGEEVNFCTQCSYWDYGVKSRRRAAHFCKCSNKYLPIYKGDANGKLWIENFNMIPDWCELNDTVDES